jgi:hypothetical protein
MPNATPTMLDNLAALHAQEERVRSLSFDQIASDPKLAFQVDAVGVSITVFFHFVTQRPDETLDVRTIQHLGIRLCNSATSSFKLLLSGYYQPAAAGLRDLLETGLLLDYLSTDPRLITAWREAGSRKEREQFEPKRVRTALDERDGFSERKREEHYRVLSTFATHPHPKGFLLIRKSGSTLAELAPFHDSTLLSALLHEAALDSLHSAEKFLQHFEMRTPDDKATHSAFSEVVRGWSVGPPYPSSGTAG